MVNRKTYGGVNKIQRRKNVVAKLQDQLKSGIKILKDGKTESKLTDGDIKRIEKEIQILKTRIK